MQIIASLNGSPVAVAALSDHGLLTASVISVRRHPKRIMPDNEDLLVPELRCRLGGLRQAPGAEEGFTVIEIPLVQGDRLSFLLKREKGHSEVLMPSAREVWMAAEPPRFAVALNGHEHQVIGQPGYGMLSMLLVWADRHPSRCVRKNGQALAQHQLEVQLAAHDTNATDITREHHWSTIPVAPTDTIGLSLLPPGMYPTPLSSREHMH